MKRLSLLVFSFLLTLLAFPLKVLAQSDFSYDYTYSLGAGDTAAAGGLVLASLVLPLVCTCILIVVLIVFTVWVNKDAKKRGVTNPILWALLTFFLFPLGLILYLVLGRKQTGATTSSTPTSTPVN